MKIIAYILTRFIIPAIAIFIYYFCALMGSYLVSYIDEVPFIFYTGFYVPFFGAGAISAVLIAIAFMFLVGWLLGIVYKDIVEGLDYLKEKLINKYK